MRFASFRRFYEVPGPGHGASDNFNATWDFLTALENWRDQGTDPARYQVVIDLVGVPGRKRRCASIRPGHAMTGPET